MVVSDILQLVEFSRKLVSRRAELNKSYFEQFIEPAWKAFVKIHEDYMKALREYAELISKEDIDIETLVTRISHDSIYTRDMRTELYGILEHMPSARLKTRERYFFDFQVSIIHYFDDRSKLDVGQTDFIGVRQTEETEAMLELSYDDSPRPIDSPDYDGLYGVPFARFPLIVFMSQKGEEANRNEAKALFNQAALDLQKRYKEATDAYYRLRKALLT
jgi:hypothetical protein